MRQALGEVSRRFHVREPVRKGAGGTVLAVGAVASVTSRPGTVADYAVIIPTRGRRQMVLQALESVFAQTVPPTEVIVVVDGDTDGSIPAIREQYPTVRVIEHESSLGAATSRNDGMAAATAEWICLLDDDDIWHQGKQEAFFGYLERHPECAALRSAFWQFSEPGRSGDLNGFRADFSTPADRHSLEHLAKGRPPVNDFSYLDIEGHSLAAMLEKNCGVTSSTMFRRELLRVIPPIPHGLATAQDWLLFVYIAAQTEWHLVLGAWFFYQVHGNQVTSRLGSGSWVHRMKAWELAWMNAGTPHGFKIVCA